MLYIYGFFNHFIILLGRVGVGVLVRSLRFSGCSVVSLESLSAAAAAGINPRQVFLMTIWRPIAPSSMFSAFRRTGARWWWVKMLINPNLKFEKVLTKLWNFGALWLVNLKDVD